MEELLWLEKEIFTSLVSSKSLLKMVNNIYTYVPENANYPFIKIGKLSKSNILFTSATLINAETQIEVFFDTQSNKECLAVLCLIENIFYNKKSLIEGYISSDFIIGDASVSYLKDSKIWQGILNFKVKMFKIH